jgi:hypothetical protein
MFNVHSRFKHDNATTRSNGVLGPFEKRDTAERALIALCQAGQATSGEIVEIVAVEPKVERCCHYTDCEEKNRLSKADEKITCSTCRKTLGLPAL